jgi:hypothetical protein
MRALCLIVQMLTGQCAAFEKNSGGSGGSGSKQTGDNGAGVISFSFAAILACLVAAIL